MELIIKDLKIDNYQINMIIKENEKIGVYSRNKIITREFLELISGINRNNNSIFFEDLNVFDNKDYFSKRLFFDFSKRYLTTLRVNKIQNALKNYNLDLDANKFISICNQLNIRGETDITYKYEFSKIGNSFVNLALLLSLEKPNLIVNNPTIHLSLQSDFDYFINALIKKNSGNLVMDLDNLDKFKNQLDRIIFFGDSGVYILNNKDSFVVFNNDVDKYFLIKDILYKKDYIIALNNNLKEEFKNYKKNGISYKIINIYDIKDYIGDANE